MRSGKVELKKIDDKTSRQVSFSKRRNGLFKKAEELSVLCDVDVALFVVSGSGKLYEFPSGDVLSKILERYGSLVAEKACTRTIHIEDCAENATVWKCKNTLQAAQSYLEGSNVNQMNITDIVQLELLLDSTLVQTRKRKAKGDCDALLSKYMQTHLTTDTLSTLQTAEKKQREEEMMMKSNETEAIKLNEGEEEADDKDKLEKKKEHQTSSSTNSEAYCSLQEAMLSLA